MEGPTIVIDFGVYFRSDRTPSHARWQGALYAIGFRVGLMPVDLDGHRGMLPVKFGGDDYDSGFAFQIEPLLTPPERLESLLRGQPFLPTRDEPFLAGMDRFACFRCNAREWPAAVRAAAGFARAYGGVFRDPYGRYIVDLGEIIAYAREDGGQPG